MTSTSPTLPFRATTEQACDWLAGQSDGGAPWTLARLIDSGLTPYVWLDYDAVHPDLFGDANGGYAAPIFFEDDTRRLAAGSDDVLITMTKDAYKIVAKLPPPGFRRELHELRFLKKDVEQLAARLKREAEPQAAKAGGATESRDGIVRDEILAAFDGLARIDLAQALDDGIGIFGDDGARVKGSGGKGKKTRHNTLWNPVTLALGLNEVYRVPVPRLKKAFASHDFLYPWRAQWELSLTLLNK
ncbi:MAG: hypothetical protein ABIQ08_02360 [Duganella sp.]